jgi:hypothetical protein
MRENRTARRACVDCKVNTFAINEYYMVRPEVWWRAGMAREGGMLCISCLENRLGRKLRRTDFSECPLNDSEYPRSERLKNRLAAGSEHVPDPSAGPCDQEI